MNTSVCVCVCVCVRELVCMGARMCTHVCMYAYNILLQGLLSILQSEW
jgi:hypothetical protein